MTAPLLDTHVSIITGGTVGIGLASAAVFAREGATVVVVSRNKDHVASAVSKLRAQCPDCDVLGIPADVCVEEDMERMVETTIKTFGRIDSLVASAGLLRAPGASLTPLVKMTLDEWDAIIDVNLRGMFLADRAVLKEMIRQGEGHIVNISSTSGRKGHAYDSAYCASKFGAIGLTESLAQEAALNGVKVQLVLPGAVDTPMWDQNGPFRRPECAMEPERVAELILHMLGLPSDTILGGVVVEPMDKPESARWGARQSLSAGGATL